MTQMDSQNPNSESAHFEDVMARSSLILDKEDSHLSNLSDGSKSVKKQGFYRLAKIYYDKSDLGKAENFFLKAVELADIPKDAFALFKIYGFLVRIYSERQEPENAEKFIQKSEELINLLSEDLGTLTAEYFYNSGVVHNYRGKFPEARESFALAYKKSKEENDPEVLVKSLHALANSYLFTKEYDVTLSYLDQLQELLKILKKDYLKGAMYNLYGKTAMEMGNYRKALDAYGKANQCLLGKHCWNLYSYILLGQGVVYKKMDDYKTALFVFEMASNVTNPDVYKRLSNLINEEIKDVNDSSVDLYLDRNNRMIYEKELGPIDFKHRFVLLEILFLLAQNPGGYFNKDHLAKAIWKDEYNPLIHDKLIYTSVSRLRKLIEPKNDKRKYILRGKDGYTFNPRVKIRFHREHVKIDESAIANVEITSPV